MKPDEDQEEMLVTYTLMQKKRPLTKFEEDLGVSSEYDRRIYDSPSARREFHESQFKGNKTTISSDGKVVHQSHKAAKNKYGKKHASLHQGEADHIDPLKNIHERVENNPLARLLLSDSDLQEVGNRRTNFQELSKGENTSKGAKSELQRGIETCDVKRVAKGISVQVETDVLLTNKAIQNAGKIFAKGAADALATSVIPLVIKGTQDLCHVANGDMTMKEATEDVGKLGGTILASEMIPFRYRHSLICNITLFSCNVSIRSLHIFTKPPHYLNIPTALGYGRALCRLPRSPRHGFAFSYHNYSIHQKHSAILPTGDFETSVCCLACGYWGRWPSGGHRTALPAS